MTINFCTRTAWRIRKLGYARKAAARYAGFFYIFMLSVCGIIGAMLCPSLKSMAGEEVARLLRLAMNVPSHVMINLITGSGKLSAGARAGRTSPGFSGIRRH
jgi:hypothetical protein